MSVVLMLFPPPPLWRYSPTRARAALLLMFLDHTRWHTTVGRTALDEGSARRRQLYLTTHNTYKRQTSMPPAGVELAILETSIRRLSLYTARPLGSPLRYDNIKTDCSSIRVCIAGMGTRLRAWRFGVRIPTGARVSSLLQNVQTGTRANPAFS